jgi:hypothetical protein
MVPFRFFAICFLVFSSDLGILSAWDMRFVVRSLLVVTECHMVCRSGSSLSLENHHRLKILVGPFGVGRGASDSLALRLAAHLDRQGCLAGAGRPSLRTRKEAPASAENQVQDGKLRPNRDGGPPGLARRATVPVPRPRPI